MQYVTVPVDFNVEKPKDCPNCGSVDIEVEGATLVILFKLGPKNKFVVDDRFSLKPVFGAKCKNCGHTIAFDEKLEGMIPPKVRAGSRRSSPK